MFPEGRMLDFLIVGVIALIVVGPKDLPILMRKVGQFVAKMRGMANEFRASFDELARQSELEELRKEVEAMRISQQSLVAPFNPLADSQTKTVFDDIGQHLNSPIASPPVMTPLAAAEASPVETVAPRPSRAPRAAAASPKTAKAKTATPKTGPAKPARAKPSRTEAPVAKTEAKPRAKPAAKASDPS